jgi:hypothetical protein
VDPDLTSTDDPPEPGSTLLCLHSYKSALLDLLG